MSKNKNKNKNSSSQTNKTEHPQGFEPFIKLDEYLTDNNFSTDYLHTAFFKEFFNGTFASSTLQSDNLMTFTVAEQQQLAVSMNYNHTRPQQEEKTVINYLLYLIQRKYENNDFPNELVFRCPGDKLNQLTASLDSLLAISGKLYCNRAGEKLGEFLAIEDIRIVEDYIYGKSDLTGFFDIEIRFSDWIKYILMNKIIRSGVQYLIFDLEWVNSELSIKSEV